VIGLSPIGAQWGNSFRSASSIPPRTSLTISSRTLSSELRSRLLPEDERTAGINTWVAGRLRGLADRLDSRGSLEKAT
jgi:hypothetical protein